MYTTPKSCPIVGELASSPMEGSSNILLDATFDKVYQIKHFFCYQLGLRQVKFYFYPLFFFFFFFLLIQFSILISAWFHPNVRLSHTLVASALGPLFTVLSSNTMGYAVLLMHGVRFHKCNFLMSIFLKQTRFCQSQKCLLTVLCHIHDHFQHSFVICNVCLDWLPP